MSLRLIFFLRLEKCKLSNAVINDNARKVLIAIGLLVLEDSLGLGLYNGRFLGCCWCKGSKSQGRTSRAEQEGRGAACLTGSDMIKNVQLEVLSTWLAQRNLR